MKKRRSPPFPIDAADWLSSAAIASMSIAEEGAYMRLLLYAWEQSDCGLPDDDAILAGLSRMGAAWGASAAKIRSRFVARDGRLYNSRQLSVKKIRSASASARAERAERKQGEKVPYGDLGVVMLTEAEHSAIVDRVGPVMARAAIIKLERYLGPSEERRRRYSDHYRCILSWAIDAPETREIAAKLEREQKGGEPSACRKCGKVLTSGVCVPCGINYERPRGSSTLVAIGG